MQSAPTKQDITTAYERIKPFIKKTPLLTSSYLNSLSGAIIHFKCENLQKTGSFKVRGAANKILQLTSHSKLCTHSSGNHAQAVSYIGLQLGSKCFIVMPSDTPQVKKDAVKHYKAEIIESGPTVAEQEQASSKVAKQQDASFVHPYNDNQIIAGAASCAYEIYQEESDIDYLVVPVGGGGLSSGSSLATHYFSPKTKVIGVQPYLARDAKDSLDKGSVQPPYPPRSLAEGVRTNLGQRTFKVLKSHLSDLILVSEEEIIDASRLFIQRMKLVVQLSGAMVLAAILKDNRFKNKKIAAIISGGNMNLAPYFKSLKEKL